MSEELWVATQARALITSYSNWTRGTEREMMVDGTLRYCATGAVREAVNRVPDHVLDDHVISYCGASIIACRNSLRNTLAERVIELLNKETRRQYRHQYSTFGIVSLNDDPAGYSRSRTMQHHRVLQVFDKLIARLIEEERRARKPVSVKEMDLVVSGD